MKSVTNNFQGKRLARLSCMQMRCHAAKKSKRMKDRVRERKRESSLNRVIRL